MGLRHWERPEALDRRGGHPAWGQQCGVGFSSGAEPMRGQAAVAVSTRGQCLSGGGKPSRGAWRTLQEKRYVGARCSGGGLSPAGARLVQERAPSGISAGTGVVLPQGRCGCWERHWQLPPQRKLAEAEQGTSLYCKRAPLQQHASACSFMPHYTLVCGHPSCGGPHIPPSLSTG